VSTLPPQDKDQKDVYDAEKNFGQEAYLEQPYQENLCRIEKLLKIPQQVEKEEEEGKDKKEHHRSGNQPVQRGEKENLSPASSQRRPPANIYTDLQFRLFYVIYVEKERR
jgi:hypothetical protein